MAARNRWNGKGTVKAVSASLIEQLFTAPEAYNAWPQAKLHTQWPVGSGHVGNPIFGLFYASQVPSLTNPESEEPMRAAGLALVDRIGPAILVTHS